MRGVFIQTKKAQSSVEYLGTYAWAFFGLILTVGTLNYLGVFNPNDLVPESCDSGNQIECMDMAAYYNTGNGETTTLILVKNNYPRMITIEDANITFEKVVISTNNPNLVISPGETGTIVFVNDSIEFVPGQKEKFKFEIDYKRYGGSTTHTITGSSNVNAQKFTTLSTYCGDGTHDSETGEECDNINTYEGTEIGNPKKWKISSDCVLPQQTCNSQCECISNVINVI